MGHKKKIHNLPPLGAAKAKGSKRGIKKVKIVIAKTTALKWTVVAKLTQTRQYPSESDSSNIMLMEESQQMFGFHPVLKKSELSADSKEYLSIDSPSHWGYSFKSIEAFSLSSYSDSPAFEMNFKLFRGARENRATNNNFVYQGAR